MHVARVDHGGRGVLAGDTADKCSLRKRCFARFRIAFLLTDERHRVGRHLALRSLFTPLFRGVRYMAVGSLKFFLTCPTSRTVLTVAYGLRLDVVEVVDVGKDRDHPEHHKHNQRDENEGPD